MEEVVGQIGEYVMDPAAISPTVGAIFNTLRILFLVVSALMLGMIIFILYKSPYLDLRFKEEFSERRKRKPYQPIKIDKDWKEVLKQAKSDDEAERKLAVIEADDLINKALSKLGYGEGGVLEQLDGISKELIPNLEDVKRAHRERRDITYDPNKKVSKEKAAELVSVYEEVFRDLQLF